MEYKKPQKCCYPNCFECSYSDCRYNGLEYSEIKLQDEFDKSLELVEPEITLRRKRQSKYSKSDKGKERLRKYARSDKGKLVAKRYMQSEKGKALQKRYLESEKGKAMQKRKAEKRIESGKNAEYCRRYYLRKKEKMANANTIRGE